MFTREIQLALQLQQQQHIERFYDSHKEDFYQAIKKWTISFKSSGIMCEA